MDIKKKTKELNFSLIKDPGTAMEPIYFVHISDLHLRSKEAQLFNIDGANKLCAVFNDIKALSIKPAFVVISGDLTSKGNCDDYRFVKSLIEEEITELDVPVFVALGNNDPREAFYEGYLGEIPSNKPY